MALIEGVGDEVTLLFGALLLLLVLVLAWASTHTAETPDHLLTTPPVTGSSSSTSSSSSLLSTPFPDQHSSPSSVTDGNTSEPLIPAPPLDSLAPPLDSLAPPLDQEGKEEPRGEEGSFGGGGRIPAGEGGERNVLGGDGLRHREGASSSSSSPVDGDLSASEAHGAPEDQRNMVVRLKFLNDTERTAQVKPHDTVGYIKRTYFAGQEHQVRLIYQGQLLQDDAQTLASLNLVHNCVLHCHISQHATRSAPAGARPADQVQVALNVGSLMVPLFMLMLSVLWYCQIQYRQFFTAPATASLVGVTIFFSLLAFGVYRR
ncbi:transmembrane and ubiquitin-like domain-containing protein 1 isoform 1-T3 [Polymixia lowei]